MKRPADGLSLTAIAANQAGPVEPGLRIARWVAGVALIVLLVLRWFYARSYLWNSDEPQHLHVVWAWASGLLPYRDVFDNHTPLFHLLSVPLFRALGERADIVLPMRLAMVPLFALSLWCVYRIGGQVFSPRAGLWSAVLLGFYPGYFFLMGEYRTDVLWTVCWLAALVVLTGGTLTRKRLFVAGLLIGSAFGVSMKTTLLLLVLLGAGLLSWLAARCFTPRTAGPSGGAAELLLAAATLVGGVLVIPAAIVAFFAAKGALGPLYYCVITHNALPGDQTPARLLQRLASWGWLTLIPACAAAAAVRPLFATDAARATRQLFLIFGAGLFYPVLHGFWRMITQQDYVPWFPLLALVLAPGVLLIERYARRAGPALSAAVLLLLVGGEVRWLLHRAPIFGAGSVREVAAIAEVLRLTDRGEFVMDPKAGLIFRPRPYYYVLESLTLKRLSLGLIADDLPDCLTRTRTAVIKYPAERLSESALEFVRANYLPVGHVAVLGKILPPALLETTLFEVTIPGRYAFISRKGPLTGTLDGQPLDGPRELSAGHHVWHGPAPASGAVMIWARALERGFSPFDLQAPKKAARPT